MATIPIEFAKGMISNHFFYKKVDKMEAAAKRMMAVLEQKSRSLITIASNNLTFQQVEMVNRAMLLLQGFQVIFSHEMEKTVEKASQAAQECLAQLDTIVHERTQEFIKNTQEQLQAYEGIANSFVATYSGKSVLTSISPMCIPPFVKTSHISIRCHGFFPHANNPRLKPTLVLQGQTFDFVHNLRYLEFLVPTKLLFSSENQPLKTIDIKLNVPSLERVFLCYSTIQPSVFTTYLCLLPDSPGKITLQYTTLKEVEEQKSFRTPDIWQDSRKHGGENNTIAHRPHVLRPEAGWSIVPGKSGIHLFHIESVGNQWLKKSDGPAELLYHVTTIKHKHKPAGRLGFYLYATVSRIKTVAEEKFESLNMKWGESVEINPSRYKEWKVIFDAFDGSRKVYYGNTDDTFISIQSPAGLPILTIKPPTSMPRDLGLSRRIS